MFRMSLRKKFIAGTALLILLVGGALALLVSHELHDRFEDEVYKRGLSVARYIAEAAEIPLITENNVSLQLLVNDYRKIDKDIGHIFLVTPNKELKIHTFGTHVPTDMARRSRCKPLTSSLLGRKFGWPIKAKPAIITKCWSRKQRRERSGDQSPSRGSLVCLHIC